MSRRPNVRAIHIRNGRKGYDSLVDSILDNPEGPEGQLFRRVEELTSTPLKKNYIEACLLATSDYGQIAQLLEIDEEVIIFYSKIYYDVEGMDHLDKVQLAGVKNREESSLKMWALTQGLEFLAWRLGKRVNVTPPMDGLKQLFDTCLYKAKEAFFNGNASKASQESTKWVKLSMDIARLLKTWSSEGTDAQNELDIRVQEVLAEFPSASDFADLFTEVSSKTVDRDISLDIPKDENQD